MTRLRPELDVAGMPRRIMTIGFHDMDDAFIGSMIDAAQELGVPFERRGRDLVITVNRPEDAYHLGRIYAAKNRK